MTQQRSNDLRIPSPEPPEQKETLLSDGTSSTRRIPSPEPPVQFPTRQIRIQDAEVDSLIRVIQARQSFQVTGSGLTVAVLDTGLRTTHVDFVGRVRSQRNFTTDNQGDVNDSSDGNGHGTNVGGIVVANGNHVGIAPGAGIVPLKVLSNSGGGSFDAVNQALQWILDNHTTYNITVASMSLGSETNDNDDAQFQQDETLRLIRQLRDLNIPVVVAAGNDYFNFGQQGMGYPAILHETVSVGAVYDANVGPFSSQNGARAFSTAADCITPFSQRLHESVNPNTRTDIFAPGAPITSSGIASDVGESVQQGTSQATPVTSGVILLMQEFFLRTTGKMPSLDTLVTCLRNGAVTINDGDDEKDNVPHTGKNFLRIDAMAALDAVRRSMQINLLSTATAFRGLTFDNQKAGI
jgi:subtilisin family serine protease